MTSNHLTLRDRLSWKILIFSLPLMASNVLQVLFNMADIAVVGRFAGALSLAAVGSTATAVTLFTGILIGIGGGDRRNRILGTDGIRLQAQNQEKLTEFLAYRYSCFFLFSFWSGAIESQNRSA
jgi:hypothetical protein